MAGLLLEDVTLVRAEHIALHVRFRAGATTTLTLPRPRLPWELRATDERVIAEIDALLAQHTCSEVAAQLNARGWKTGAGAPFTNASIKWIIFSAKLETFKARLRRGGMLTATELAQQLGVAVVTIKTWRRQGRLAARRCNDRHEWLYHPSDGPAAPKHTARPRRRTASAHESTGGGAV